MLSFYNNFLVLHTSFHVKFKNIDVHTVRIKYADMIAGLSVQGNTLLVIASESSELVMQ